MKKEQLSRNNILTIVIPVYNEERRIAQCLNHLLEYINEHHLQAEVVLSEDGSVDRTLDIANAFAMRSPMIKVVHSDRRLGKGGGIRRGVEASTGCYVMFMDVDLATKPDQIPKLMTALRQGYEVVLGSRSLARSKILIYRSPARKLLSWLYNWLLRLLFHVRVSDAQCGFKCLKRYAFIDLFGHVRMQGYAFDTDLIVQAYRRRYRVIEVPVEYSEQKYSKLNVLLHGPQILKDLIVLRLLDR